MKTLLTRPISWLCIVFVMLGLAYAWATPPFEASDEYWHFGMLEFIHNQHDLPIQDPTDPDMIWRQEGSQPPLYYAFAATLISPFDIGNVDTYRVLNPHVRAGQPESFGNKNLVMHDAPDQYTEPSMMAVYLVRGFGILLGLVTVITVYANTQLILPDTSWASLLAAGMLAFNPMFLFISASINNDNLAITLCSIVIYLILRMLRDGFVLRRSLWLAIILALATLSKLSALVLVPVVVLAALWVAYRDKAWSDFIQLGIFVAGAWAILAGWWYLRNIQLYDELFGTSMMVEIAGGREEPFTLSTALTEFKGFRWSFWAVFGVFDLIVPYRWFYALLDAFTVVAGIGIIIRIRALFHRRQSPSAQNDLFRILMLLLVVGIGFIAFLQWTAQTYASQGRLLFPYNAAIMPLMALGLVEAISYLARILQPAFNQRLTTTWFGLIPVGILGLVALIIPFTLIAPTYRLPEPVDEIPTRAASVYARYGDVELIAYRADHPRYSPEDTVEVTLYWHVLDQSSLDYSLALALVNTDGVEMGKVDTYPGAGRLRTSTWQAGTTYADTYEIAFHDNVVSRDALRLYIRWWHYPTETYIDPTDENGQSLSNAVLLDVGALVSSDIVPDTEYFTSINPISFGNSIRLLGYNYDPDNHLIRLHWEAVGIPDDDYRVLVHVLDAESNLARQGDAAPILPTHYWQPGEHFVTDHVLHDVQTPVPGTGRIIIGWYKDDIRLETDHPENIFVLLELEF